MLPPIWVTATFSLQVSLTQLSFLIHLPALGRLGFQKQYVLLQTYRRQLSDSQWPRPRLTEPKSSPSLKFSVTCLPCTTGHLHLCRHPSTGCYLNHIQMSGSSSSLTSPLNTGFWRQTTNPDVTVDTMAAFVWITTKRKGSDKDLKANTVFKSYRKGYREVERGAGRKSSQQKVQIKPVTIGAAGAQPCGHGLARTGHTPHLFPPRGGSWKMIHQLESPVTAGEPLRLQLTPPSTSSLWARPVARESP